MPGGSARVATEIRIIHERYIISAPENRSHHGAADKHIHVFRKQIKSQFHGGIFLVVSDIQFTFCFGQIKGRTVTFRKSTDQENKKAQGLIKYIIFMIHLLLHDRAADSGNR